MAIKLLNDPVEVLTVEQVKAWVKREGTTDEDDLFAILIKASREFAEEYTGLFMSRRLIETTINSSGSEVKLDHGPDLSIETVHRMDVPGGTLLTTGYTLDGNKFYFNNGLIGFSSIWRASVGKLYYPYKVVYEAGFEVGKVPGELQVAMLECIAFSWKNRGDISQAGGANQTIRIAPPGAIRTFKLYMLDRWARE